MIDSYKLYPQYVADKIRLYTTDESIAWIERPMGQSEFTKGDESQGMIAFGKVLRVVFIGMIALVGLGMLIAGGLAGILMSLGTFALLAIVYPRLREGKQDNRPENFPQKIYVITNKKVLIFMNGNVHIYEKQELNNIKIKEKPDGSGDIIIEHIKEDNGEAGLYELKIGFLKIADVKRTMKEIQKLIDK